MTITHTSGADDFTEKLAVPPLKFGLGIAHVLPITTEAEGVTLHLDLASGDSWIQVSIDSQGSLAQFAFEEVARSYGLELDDDPYYDDIDADGNVRIPLVEVIP